MLKKSIFALFSVVAITGCANVASQTTPTTQNLSGSPIQQVFQLNPQIGQDVTRVTISQVSDSGESPENSTVVLTQSGLFDDSVVAERTTYLFKSKDRVWSLVNKRAEYQCARGDNTTTFQTKLCP